MAPPGERADPDSRGSDVSSLPLDALYEVLLRLPAKDLCRLRCVCRPWRALLSDPGFIDAHAARHPGPLIVAGSHPLALDPSILFDILDLSGRVIKRFRKIEGPQSIERLTCYQLDVVCIEKGMRRDCVLLSPATGSLLALPGGYAEELSLEVYHPYFKQVVAFGQVAWIGQYKVLRVIDRLSYEEQLWEVFNFDTSIHARWRGKRPPLGDVIMRNSCSIVIKGVAHFLLDEFALDRVQGSICIASFDLGAEDWRTTLQGPMIGSGIDYDDLSLTSLNDCLVVVHCNQFFSSTLDLWFLKDFEKGLWVKQHSIQRQLRFDQDEFSIHPLLMLNDGRILTYIGNHGLLRIYNPRTSTFTNVANIGPCGEIGLYTGDLLRLACDAG